MMTMISFADLLGNTAGRAADIFTEIADAAPGAFSSAASKVGEGGAAFVDAADGAADALLLGGESIRDGSGGFIDPTVLYGGLQGADLMPFLVGLVYLIVLLLARLVFVICQKLRTRRRRSKRRNRGRTGGKPYLARLWSIRTSLCGEVWEHESRSQDSMDIDEVGSQQSRGDFFSAGVGDPLMSLPSSRRGLSERSGSAPSQTDGQKAEGAGLTPQMARPLPPLRLLGPTVTSLEYVASQPPPEVPSLFATARYRSIHRKLILDMRRLTFGRCNPQQHPAIDVADKSRETSNEIDRPQRTRILISEMTASRRRIDDTSSNGAQANPTSWRPDDEMREVSFEALLNVKQTFGPPNFISIDSVLNASAIPPEGCGALELTLDISSQMWEKQLMEELSDPNKAVAHIIQVESHQKELMKGFVNSSNDSNDLRIEHDEDAEDEAEPTVVNTEESEKNINVKDLPVKTITEEYTFDSARDAAEFQSVTLALRIVGKEIRNMYSSLEVLDTPSTRFDESNIDGEVTKEGDEISVESGSRPGPPGVALDDAYRCLGEIPSIRRCLERFYRYHYPVELDAHWEVSEHGIDSLASPNLLTNAAEDADTVGDDDGNEITVSTYQKKRLRLGIVDFLRLFLPPPEAGAAPRPNPSAAREVDEEDDDGGIDAHKERVISAVTIRKRVARASVRVQLYVNAARVVRAGWPLPAPVPSLGTASSSQQLDTSSGSDEKEISSKVPQYRRRMAFDDDIENIRRDCSKRNEYYEATVGRDVGCRVHDSMHMVRRGSSRSSGYQGFSLVGCHVFRIPEEEGSGSNKFHPLQPENDPLLALPSLRSIIGGQPELDFFVLSFFSRKQRVALVMLFVRTLPRGVDEHFDNVIGAFVSGDAAIRDRKLEVFLQLGPGFQLPGSIWAALKVINWMLRFARKGEGEIPVVSNKVRTPFPGMRLSSYTALRHFGGSLQNNNSLPKNYVAATATIVEEALQNPIIRGMLQHLEEGVLPHCVVDVTIVFEGQSADELPERALGTARLVHLHAEQCALPISFGSTGTIAAPRAQHLSNLRPHTWSLKDLTQSTLNVFGIGQRAEEENNLLDEGNEDAISNTDSVDLYKFDLDALEEILDGVSVPVRKVNLSLEQNMAMSTTERAVAPGNRHVSTVSAAGAAVGSGVGPQTPRTVDGFKISKDELANVPVLQTCSRKDLTRYYLASYGDLKATAVRVVESSAWRGLTFPIDIRACRIELRSNQFVQYGEDILGNPVFYFRNMCLGPWRNDVEATVLAILHRLETSMKSIALKNPAAKCVVVVIMGKPVLGKSADDGIVDGDDADDEGDTGDEEGDADETGRSDKKEEEEKGGDENDNNEKTQMERNPFIIGSDPRIDPSEEYFVHTNPALIHRLVRLLSTHYPERLAKALIVPSGGWEKTMGGLSIRGYVSSPRTRSRIVVLNSASDLREHISKNSLLSFAGGKAKLPPECFE